MKINCPNCSTTLKFNDEHRGKRAKCSKCGNKIQIPPFAAPPPPSDVKLAVPVPVPPTASRTESKAVSSSPIPLATERQKEFARSLGVEFAPDINRREISKLIDEAVTKEEDARLERSIELNNRESQAWKEMQEEVFTNVIESGKLLSNISETQMVEEFATRGLGAVLITFDMDQVETFDDLVGVEFTTTFSKNMNKSDARSLLMMMGVMMMNRPDL